MAAKKTIKRIKLANGKATVEEKPTVTSSDAKKETKGFSAPSPKHLLTPVTGPADYVKGSWQELRQVRWPSRKSTWGLTFAVILFTLFFTVVILLLDAAFHFIFKEVLLK